MIAGAICWIISEILEIVHGGYNPVILWLTVLFHLLAAVGIWGLHLGQAKGKNSLSFSGTALLSIGYLAFAAVPLIVIAGDFDGPAGVMEAYPAFRLFGAMSVIGILMFGAAVVKLRYFPAWAGIAFVMGSLVTFTILATHQSMLIANAANILVSVVLIKMAWQVIHHDQLKTI